MKKSFVPADKRSKKAKKALASAKRRLWALDPRSRVVESKKTYRRCQAKRVVPED